VLDDHYPIIRSSLVAIEARSLHRGFAQRIGRVVNIYIVNIYIYIYIYIYVHTYTHTYTGTIGKCWKVCWLSWHGKPLFSRQCYARGMVAVVCPFVYLKYYASIGVLSPCCFPFLGPTKNLRIIAHVACTYRPDKPRSYPICARGKEIAHGDVVIHIACWRAQFCPDNSEYCTTKTKTHYMCKKKRRVSGSGFFFSVNARLLLALCVVFAFIGGDDRQNTIARRARRAPRGRLEGGGVGGRGGGRKEKIPTKGRDQRRFSFSRELSRVECMQYDGNQ